MGNIEARARRMTEVQIPSLEYGMQRSKADKNVHALQEHSPEFVCASIYQKSKRKSVTFLEVISNGKDRASPSATEQLANRKDDEEKEETYHSKKEETTAPSELEEAVQVLPGHEGSEMEIALNKLADSPLFYMAPPQDSKVAAEGLDIPEQFSGQVKPLEIDTPFKPDASDSQTSSVDGQTRPVKELENENIHSVTVKKLREVQFSPTTFRRKTFAVNINVTEKNIFSSEGIGNREEEMPENKRHKLYKDLPESYCVHLAAQEDPGVPEEQGAQKVNTSQQFLSLKPPVVSTGTETKVKEECSMKIAKRRKLHSYYDVKEEIGRGSYGFVKRVVNKQSGTSCAAKFIPLRRSTRSQAYEELAIISRVNHPKIACLLDMLETKRTLVLVLEMCSNEGLLDHLFKKNIVAETEVRYYIQQILEGVQYLHDNNILHLDIKPANILMVHPERDDVKMCDFGFAQEFSPIQPQFSKYGCPEFVAPEIVFQDPISTATDIWAVGVITFLCLTGSSPFAGENDRATLMNVKEGSFSWDELDLDCISEDAQNFITRIIRIIPQDRPTASECLKELWFQDKQKLQESCMVNTKRLKFFISRNKWQRSLMSYKSILVMRSIPQLLKGTSEGLSLGMSRHLLKESSSPSTSASSSDFEDCTHQTETCSTHTPDVNQAVFDQYFANEDEHCETPWFASSSTDILGPNISEHKRDRPVLTRRAAVENQADVKHGTSEKCGEGDMKAQQKYSETCKELNLSANTMKHPISKAATIETSDCSRVEGAATHNLVRGISADSALTLQLSGQGNLLDTSSKPSSRLLPRHSLIKSTFYSDTLETRDLSTEDAEYARSLERTRKRFVQAGYTKGKVSGLRQPLLECFQMGQDRTSDDERFKGTSSHISGRLAKSASYDNGNSVAYSPKEHSRRSKSLDEFETEFLVQTTARESESEIQEPFAQHSSPDSNTVTGFSDVITHQPVALDAQELGMFKCMLSDTMCLSEEGTFLTDIKYILECPTKNIPFEKDQSVKTDAASLQYYDKPTNSHSDVSGFRSFDLQQPMNSELQSEISSVAASVVTSEPQEQSSSENVSSLYFDVAEPDTDYFDLSEPYSCELQYKQCPSFLSQKFEEKSASEAKPLPVPWTSEELFPSRETETKKDSPLQGKLDQTSTTSYEILYDEIEPSTECSWNLTTGEWESDLLELLKDTEENETTSDTEEGESKNKKKSKRTSLENKIHQSFESLRKAFKSQKDAKTPIASSETSLTVSETHTDPSSKSTSETFGRSGLLRLFSRSASLNWDKGLHQLDEDGGGSRYSLSVLRDLNLSKHLQGSRGTRKSQTLPAHFSWHLKSEEKPKLRKQKERDLSKPQGSTDPSNTEFHRSQYMEVMKVPFIPPLTPHDEVVEKQQVTMQSTDIRDNPSGSLKKKSGLFSFKLPSSKAKEKAPSFLEGLINQSVVLNQSVNLSCRPSGYPNPDILWFKENQLVCYTDRILSSTTSKNCQFLTILNVAEEDLGSYKCVAENRLGKASTCCLLNLAAVPCHPDSPEVAQVYEDGALVIWKPLATNTPITYIIECQRKGEEWKTVASDLSESCFYASNLHRGETYSYRVAYVSKAGKGPFSQPSAEVIIGETEVQSHSIHGEKLASVHETYTFVTEINRGRFSIIKKCIENSSREPLAAKITPYKKQSKPFVLKEYEILKKLHHNNIVQLHGAYITPKYLVLIQELCEGKELFRNLAERSSYTEYHVVELLTQMLSAVEYLHLNHTLHLDLKSENIIIVEHNVLKLLDFGNAEVLMPGRPVLVEKCRDFVENMAPEILEGKAVVPETDIWAVGVLTFTMLSADCPFRSDKDCDKEKNIRKGKIKLRRCYAGLSQGAVSFLKNTLCLNPGGRPCASECRSFPWLQEDSQMKLRHSTVSFQTTKLRNYLKQREKRRMLLCTKHEVLILH